MITNYVLRADADNAWGAWKLDSVLGRALVSDLLPVVPDGAVTNHGDTYNVLFDDVSVKAFSDAGGSVANVFGADAEGDVEKKVSDAFSIYFDLMYSSN